MAVTLIHEWLTNLAGSEKVVAALRSTFPGAPVVTSLWWRPAFPDWDVRPTVLQPLATGPESHLRALPLIPLAFRTARIPDADVVVTSFHTFALQASVPRDAAHVVYCHTPPRFLWAARQLEGERLPGQRVLGAARRGLQQLDRRRAARPTLFLANSQAVARRIARSYARAAPVVNPPVDVGRFTAALGQPVGEEFVVLSRLVPYKRVDLAIEAFAELGLPLAVAGTGRAAERLRAGAPPNVRFLGHVPDADVPGLLARARALVFPGEEDFGITPVEAMAAGTPVVAFGRGGAAETVQDGLSGVLFDRQDAASLMGAVRRAASTEWDRPAISASVARFAEDRFRAEIRDVVGSLTS